MADITFTWDDVIALAPELANVSVAGQTQVINQVILEVKPSMWGSVEKATTAGIWLARHLATLYRRGGNGVLTGVHAGQVGKNFGMPQWKSLLATTMYGMEYLRLVRLYMPRFALT